MASNPFRTRLLGTLIALSVAVPAMAQGVTSALAPTATAAKAPLTRISIGNFGRVNDNYYRGAQPKGRDYTDLAAMGVKTVLDLQKDGRSDESGLVQKAGMRFFRIPLTTTERPTDAQVAEFFKIVNDPANQPVFVHCAGGRHRTGTMTALYRMTFEGWNADRAYSEMKQFRFEGWPDHPVLRKFVYAYTPVPTTPAAVPGVLATTVVTGK